MKTIAHILAISIAFMGVASNGNAIQSEQGDLPSAAGLSKGHPVLLRDGELLGHVSAIWPDQPGKVLVNIVIHRGHGLIDPGFTLAIPEPVSPRRPITLNLSHEEIAQLLNEKKPVRKASR